MTILLQNINYCVDAPVNPKVYETKPYEGPFNIVASSLVRDMNQPLSIFMERLENEIKQITSYPNPTFLLELPEFCWRTTDPKEVFDCIHELKTKIPKDLTIVLGTLEFTLNGKYTNNAIILHDGHLWYVPKTKVLKTENNQGMVSGENPGVIDLPHFKLGVVVCADLWEETLMRKIVRQGADIIVAPSWTATLKGNRKNARKEFRALIRTRCLEWQLPIVVADHLNNTLKSDVANATLICSPANRGKKFPKEEYVERDIEVIELRKVREARAKWEEKGLAPLYRKDIMFDIDGEG